MGERTDSFRERVLTRYFLDLAGGYRNTVLLAGCARSGSTWVSDLINYDRGYRYIFEPFRNDRAALCHIFEGRQYLRPDADAPSFYHAVSQVLTGRLRQRWSDKHNSALIARRRLVKAIRINLMLKWVRVNFPGMPMILLLRHPLAVVSSKLKLRWPVDFDSFLRQEALMEGHLEPFRDLMTSNLPLFERHLLFWCIEHYVPLRELGRDDVAIAFYEGFCAEPQRELSLLFGHLGRGSAQGAMKVLHRPSSVTPKHSAINTGQSLTHAWAGEISDDQKRIAAEMLERFGLHRIYLEDGMPTRDLDDVFLSGV